MALLDEGTGGTAPPPLPDPDAVRAAQAAYQSGAGINPASGGLASLIPYQGEPVPPTAPLPGLFNVPVLGGALRFAGNTFANAPLGSQGAVPASANLIQAYNQFGPNAPETEAARQAFGQASVGVVAGTGEVGGAGFGGGRSELEQQLADSIAARTAKAGVTPEAKAFGVTPQAQAISAVREISDEVKAQVRRMARGDPHTLTDADLHAAVDGALTKVKAPLTDANRVAVLDALSKEQVARNTGGAARNAARQQAVQAVSRPAAEPTGLAVGSPRGPLASRLTPEAVAARRPGVASNEALATARGEAFQPGTGGALRPSLGPLQLPPDTRVPQVVGGKPDITNIANAMRAAGASDAEIAAYLKVKPGELPKGEGAPPTPPSGPTGTTPPEAPPPKGGAPPPPSQSRPWTAFLDLWNLPKALKASWDLSAPGRQGILTAAAHPGEFFGNFKPMIQAFASTKFAHAVDAELRAGPKSQIVQDGLAQLGLTGRSPRLFLADHAGLSGREEAFMTRLAGKIPFVKNSEQAYITYLNKLRADIYDNTLERWFSQGKNVTKADVDGLADVVNHFTGRGDLTFGTQITPVLNGLFFSPRFTISRFQSVGDALGAVKSRDSLAAKEAANMMVKNVAAGLSILALAKFAGSPIETDPRSANFGKIVVGNTTYDIWGGQQQIARYVAQFLTGQTKVGSGKTQGQIATANRGQTLGRFVQSKLSPSAGTAAEVIGYTPSKKDPRGTIGRDFVGQPFSLTDLVNPTKSTNLLVPLVGQDFADAIKDIQAHGGTAIGAGIKTIPSFFGIGTSTH